MMLPWMFKKKKKDSARAEYFWELLGNDLGETGSYLKERIFSAVPWLLSLDSGQIAGDLSPTTPGSFVAAILPLGS